MEKNRLIVSLYQTMHARFQTELIKANIASFSMHSGEEWNKMCGTSFSTNVFSPKLDINSILLNSGLEKLAEVICESLLVANDKIKPQLNLTNQKKEEPLFYAIEISPKVIAWISGVVIKEKNFISLGLKNWTAFSKLKFKERQKVLNFCKEQTDKKINSYCLLLADKTHLPGVENSIIIPPLEINEIMVELAKKIKEYLECFNSSKDVSIPTLIFTTDTDSPHRKQLFFKKPMNKLAFSPPGITLLGSTGKAKDFNGFRLFRLGLISQLIRGNSISSQINHFARPFTFFGAVNYESCNLAVVKLQKLNQLRYSGCLDEYKEISAIIDDIFKITFGRKITKKEKVQLLKDEGATGTDSV